MKRLKVNTRKPLEAVTTRYKCKFCYWAKRLHTSFSLTAAPSLAAIRGEMRWT